MEGGSGSVALVSCQRMACEAKPCHDRRYEQKSDVYRARYFVSVFDELASEFNQSLTPNIPAYA